MSTSIKTFVEFCNDFAEYSYNILGDAMKCILGIPVRYNDLRNRYQCSTPLIDRLNALRVHVRMIYPQQNLSEIINECDGLLLPGGDDIDPLIYDEVIESHTLCVDAKIDELDFELLRLFEAAKKPIFGLCRGIQVIAVAHGTKLAQHIENHQSTTHQILTHPSSSFVKGISLVNSYHHQALATCPKGFILSAVSDDGWIEAIENELIWAVQWHPELDELDVVLPRFVEHVFQKKIEENQNR